LPRAGANRTVRLKGIPAGGRTGMIKGFRQFLLRGSVIDLAIAVVIGGAFLAVVKSLVDNLLTPLIAAIFGKQDFGALSFTIHNSTFTYGTFINDLITFVLVATAVYFVVVVPVNTLRERQARGRPPEDPTVKQCPECLSEIPVAARRCAYCTSEQQATAP
jgi:large conductance mechanosensitive channel